MVTFSSSIVTKLSVVINSISPQNTINDLKVQSDNQIKTTSSRRNVDDNNIIPPVLPVATPPSTALATTTTTKLAIQWTCDECHHSCIPIRSESRCLW